MRRNGIHITTGLDHMPVGEDDPPALVDDEAGGVAGAGGLGVEGAAGGGAKHDHGGDDLVQRPPPVLGRGHVLAKRRVDLHAQLVLGAARPLHQPHRVRSQPLQLIPHSQSSARSSCRCELFPGKWRKSRESLGF
jgi:hypothetical protein